MKSTDTKGRTYWDFLSEKQKDLIRQGSYLYQEVFADGKYSFTDYSFLVFPFAKAYEGFLKKLFLLCSFISVEDYNSDHIRLGKLLSPELADRLGTESVYSKVKDSFSESLALSLWEAWKYSRNQVFHYYPHNELSLTLQDAKERIDLILDAIRQSYEAYQALAHYRA
jgi:hypothetical protein